MTLHRFVCHSLVASLNGSLLVLFTCVCMKVVASDAATVTVPVGTVIVAIVGVL